LQNTGTETQANAVGTEANFVCGSFVRFSFAIGTENPTVTDLTFVSNGCGYMLAAADVLVENIKGKRLSDLHGLNDTVLRMQIRIALEDIPHERSGCIDACINALRAGFIDFRSRQVEEFRGERALICTCFSVSQDAIEALILSETLENVDEVGDLCGAGSGCGSCRMLIQEILDGLALKL